MWDLPGPGLEPMSPALAGRFLTTAPPGKKLGLFIGETVITLYISVSLNGSKLLCAGLVSPHPKGYIGPSIRVIFNYLKE